MLTHERLLEVLFYDRNTGIFTWKVNKSQATKAGTLAGTTCIKDGYIVISVDSKTYKAHRLAWFYETCQMPPECIDHINRIRTDNRFCNLRLATKKQNMENTKIRKDSSSGYRGVSFKKEINSWIGYVSHNKKQYYLGKFETKELASAAVEAKRFELFTHYQTA